MKLGENICRCQELPTPGSNFHLDSEELDLGSVEPDNDAADRRRYKQTGEDWIGGGRRLDTGDIHTPGNKFHFSADMGN